MKFVTQNFHWVKNLIQPPSAEYPKKLNWIFKFTIVYWIFSFLIVFYFPPGDYDSNAFYNLRYKLEEFGHLKTTAPISILYLFPTFFENLHIPFLKLGYFIGMPSFILATVFLVLSLKEIKSRYVQAILLLFIFASQPFLIMLTHTKSDLALGVFAFLAWFFIYRLPYSDYYLGICLAPLFCLVGTKWFGIPLAGFFFLILLLKSIQSKLITPRRVAFALLMLPLYWWMGSIEVYIANLRDFHSLTPLIPTTFLNNDRHHFNILPNFPRFILSSIADTLDPIQWAIEIIIGHPLLDLAQKLTLTGRTHRLLIMPSVELNSFGILIPGFLALSLRRFLRTKLWDEYTAAALISIAYVLIILCTIRYSTGTSRYLFPVFTLLLIPSSYEFLDLVKKRKVWLIGLLILASSNTWISTFWNHDRRLLPIGYQEGNSIHWYDTAFARIRDHEFQWFNIWGGELEFFDHMRKTVFPSDSMLIVNRHGEESDFLYPYVKDRSGTNTRYWNALITGEPSKELLQRFHFLLFSTPNEEKIPPGYQLLYSQYKAKYLFVKKAEIPQPEPKSTAK